MSVLVVGLSHSSAPVPVLERAVVTPSDVPAVLAQLAELPDAEGSLVVSTCNRVELYVEVPRFHSGVAEVSALLARRAGLPLESLSEHLFVHWEDAAVEHLFTVAAGLDSLVVGEPQVLGQLRDAYGLARDAGTVSRGLHELVQAALRVGKRVRSETGLDRAGADLVSVGLDAAAEAVGGLEGRRALLVGAGSMGALAGAWLRRRGVAEVAVANRGRDRAQRLAETLEGRAASLDDLVAELAAADVVVSSTGATGTVLSADVVRAAVAERERGGAPAPLAVLDLALPRDVEPAVRSLPGVVLTDLETLQAALAHTGGGEAVTASAGLVADEVAAFLAGQRSTRVAPTVVALRAKAAAVVDDELGRLAARLPQLDDAARAEVEATVRRVVQTLLHAPTVRVKELAAGPGGDAYAEALRELFELDPAAPAAVARASSPTAAARAASTGGAAARAASTGGAGGTDAARAREDA